MEEEIYSSVKYHIGLTPIKESVFINEVGVVFTLEVDKVSGERYLKSH